MKKHPRFAPPWRTNRGVFFLAFSAVASILGISSGDFRAMFHRHHSEEAGIPDCPPPRSLLGWILAILGYAAFSLVVLADRLLAKLRHLRR